MRHKIYLLLLAVWFTSQGLFAQHQKHTHSNGMSCGSDHINEIYFQNNPEVFQKRRAFDREISRLKKNGMIYSAMNLNSQEVYEIPIVVHIIHTGEPIGSLNNPSDQQIFNWVNHANEVLAGTANGVVGEGNGGTNIPIRLVLAKRTENCESTNGIVRVDASGVIGYVEKGVDYYNQIGIGSEALGAGQKSIRDLTRWNPESYYNIYIVKEITDGYAGFAYLAGASPEFDGSFMVSSTVNTSYTTFAHEMGHAFGLLHTFQGGDFETETCPPVEDDCTLQGDLVCDTERIKSSLSYSYFNYPDNNTINPCTGVNYQGTQYNIMHYGAILNRFTPGQRDRAILQLLEYRGNLINSLGGQEPEISNIVLTEMCQPVPPQYSGNNMGPVKVSFGDILVVSEASLNSDSSYFDYSNSCLVKGSTTIPGYEPTILSVSTAQYSFSTQGVKVYIDWNNNGNFEEAIETVMDEWNVSPGTNFGPGTVTIAVTPPPHAVKGVPLRMRVAAGVITNTSCYTPEYGQVEDYAVTVIESINGCEGISEEITAQISQETAFDGSELYLTADGVLGSAGITYQWQKSPNGISDWTDVVNANAMVAVINAEGEITDKTYFRLKVTCTETQTEHISSVVFYEIVPEYCYAGASNNFSAKINNVSFANIDNTSTGYDYEDFTNIVADVIIGNTYTFSASTQSTTGAVNYEILVWVDFNYDGDFDDDGEFLLQTSGTSPWTGNITIPENVSLGQRRMRIRLHSTNYYQPNATPCGYSDFGQVEDYTINITDLNCEGISDNIIASMASGSGAENSQLALTATGVQGVQGINYQWQKSVNNTSDWEDITNATTKNLTTTIQEVAGNTVYYRLKVVCIETQSTHYSQEVPVIIHCIPTTTLFVHERINNITLSDINYSNISSATYVNIPQVAGNLTAGETYPFSAIGSLDYPQDELRVWIDYNKNGSFEDEGELVLVTSGASPWNGNITIPGNVESGIARMRVRLTYGSGGTSCQSSSYGQTIDLMVNIQEIEGCIGISNNIVAQILDVNSNSISLGAEGVAGTPQSINYQWQQNIEGTNTWENIENANSINKTIAVTSPIGQTINYRLKVTCLITEEEHFSNVISYEVIPYYCAAGATSTQFHKINNVTFAGINNNSTSTAGYEDFTNIVTDLQTGNTYAFSASSFEQTYYYDELFVWIDFNYDGDFDDEGELVLQTSGSSPWTGNITIPENVSLGERRMRIRMHYNQPDSVFTPNSTPCGNSTIGQVEDYTVNIIDIGCAGISENIIASLSNLNEEQTTLTAQGVEGTSLNISYQWQQNIGETSEWVDIENANSLNSTVAIVGSIGQTINYRLKVTCLMSEEEHFSNVVSHEIITYYCAAAANSGDYESISNITFAGINNNSSSTTGYEDFTHVTTDVISGNQYSFSASFTGESYSSDQVLVWIDFNNDGDFNDQGELVLQTATSSSPWTGNITIPENVSLGNKRMRIRLHDTSFTPNYTPCGNSDFGQVEDYTINIIDLGCTGISDNIVASLSNINEGQITLNAQGVEGTPQNISYQWLENTEGTSVWENIANATTLSTVITPVGEIGQVKNYRLQVTCLETQTTFYSTIVSHEIIMTYCSAGADNEGNVYITNVTFAGINNSSASNQVYENFTSITGTVERVKNYSFSVGLNSNIYRQVFVWIDYNNNGSFEDEGEQVLQLDSSPWIGNISIPSNATLGETRMRIRTQYTDQFITNNTPCGNSEFGQVEDYTINIIDLGCSGISENIIVSLTNLNEEQNTLSAEGVEGTSLNISYQWQQNIQGTSIWENIENATTLSAVVTISGEPGETINYRLQVTCLQNQEIYYSTIASYQLPEEALSYCSAGADEAGWEYISNISFSDIDNNSDIYDGYEDYTAIVGTVQQGETYSFTVSGEFFDNYHEVLVWIDYNKNGSFEDEGELALLSEFVSYPWTENITIPTNTSLGNTRMRILLQNKYDGSYSPCGNTPYGQVEDYTINILPALSNDCSVSTTWNGTTWSNGNPDITKKAIIDGLLVMNTDLSACELEVTENGKITIPADRTLTAKGQVINHATATDFVVANDGMLIQIDDVENQGAITVLRNSNPMKRLDYTLWSSPVEGMLLKNFSQVSPAGGTGTIWNRVYTLGELAWEQVWNSYNEVETGSETFDIAKGYLYRAKNSYHSTNTVIFEGEFTGTPNNGSISISTPLSFNGIGNPYPSAIDVDELMIANSGVNALYFWTNVNAPVGGNYVLNNWASYTIMGGAGVASNGNGEQEYEPKGIIMPGQGFVIQTSGAHVLFNNSMRTSENEGFFRQMNNDRHRFWLNLSDDVVSYNQILVGYMENATQAVDTGIDAQMYAYEGNAIYSLIENDNKPFVIQGRSLPFLDTDIVKIGFRAVNAGSFTIALDSFDGLFAEGYTTIYLKDNFNGNSHNLNSGAYSFLSETGVFDNRFEIVYQTTMNVENPELNDADWIVYKQDKHFQVQTKGFELKEVWVYDLLGRILYKADAESTTHLIPALDVDGVFIVKIVTTQDKVLNKKVR
jgi:hypothetical protein